MGAMKELFYQEEESAHSVHPTNSSDTGSQSMNEVIRAAFINNKTVPDPDDLKLQGVFYLEPPAQIGIEQRLAEVMRKIARATKKSADLIWGGIKSFLKFVLKKLDEGAEMHNHRQAYMHNHWRSYNPDHLRCL